MSKLQGSFTYKDWCIIKHSLMNSIKIKVDMLRIDELIITNNMVPHERIIMQEQIEEEKRTLERITERVDDFKRYIGRMK